MEREGYVKFLVRFPVGLLDSLKQWAAENRRTVTAEIVYRLEQSIRAEARKTSRHRSS